MTWATGKARNFRELICVRGLMGVSEAAYLPAGLALIADHHGERTRSLATGIHYGGAYLGIVLGGVAGILLGGILADRWGTRSERGRLMTQAAGLALGAPFLCIIGLTNSGWVLVAALTAFGVGRGSYDCSCMPVLSQIASPERRATGYGVFNFVGTFAGGISAALAGGLKHTIGLGGAMVAASVVVLVAAFLLFRLNLCTVQPA
jgi:MFS family permease